MDCSSEYFDDDESEDTSKIVTHNVNEVGLIDAPTKSKYVNNMSMEKYMILTDGKDVKDDVPLQAISCEKEMEVINETKSKQNKQKFTMLKRQKDVKFMNLIDIKQRYQGKTKQQENDNEEQFDCDKVQEHLNKKNGEMVVLYLDKNEQELMIASKVNAIASLESKFHDYKDEFIRKTRASKAKINDYIIELLKKENSIKNKLRQKWRLFGKSVLRKELREIEELRQTLDCKFVDKMKEEIEYLELGYFTLSHQ